MLGGKGSEQRASGMGTNSLGLVWKAWPEPSLRAVDLSHPGPLAARLTRGGPLRGLLWLLPTQP